MGKPRKKTSKRQASPERIEQDTNQNARRRRTRSTSGGKLDALPPQQKRRKSAVKKSPDTARISSKSKDTVASSTASSILSLVKTVEEGRFSKLSEGIKRLSTKETFEPPEYKFQGISKPESLPDEVKDSGMSVSEVSQGQSDTTQESEQSEKMNKTPTRPTQKPCTTPKSSVKAYGMPQIIKGKIIGETDSSIYLKLNKSITICGKVFVRAVKGTVKVAGFEIPPSGQKYPVYSPNCYALLTVSVVDTLSMNVDGIQADIKKNITELNEQCAVIEMSTLRCEKCDFVTSFGKNQNLFLSPGFPLPVVETRVITDKLPTLLEDPSHKDVADRMCQLISSGSMPVVMLCGGKNAGKSTFCRYLLNRALSVKRCNKVAFLECDVGQTEFTPSSCVSMSIVTEPLLGPPFTHNTWPSAAVYYGEASPDKDAHGYLDSVKKMYKAYTELPYQAPLIVNTMGWNKGLGLRLFLDTLRMTQATHIVQIDHPSPGRDFPSMDPELVDVMDGFVSRAGGKSHHEVIHVKSLLQLTAEGRGQFVPRDYRNLIFFSYFGGQGAGSLTKVVPWEVPWSAIAVHITSPSTSRAQILHALNGSVVGLCVVPSKKLPRPSSDKDKHSSPRILDTNKRFTPLCKGLGIIRSIDPERRVFHVITPLPYNQLQEVNCFKLGALTLPEQIITTQKLTEALPGTIPYYGGYIDSMASSKVPKRRHMVRGQKQ